METQSLIIIAIVVAVVAIAGFFIFRIFIGGQKAADNEVGRHQQDIDDQKQVNRLKSEERVRDDRVHGDGVRDDRTAGDRVHDDRDVLRDQPDDVGPDRRA